MPSDTRRICGPADETRAPLDEKRLKEDRAKRVSGRVKLSSLPALPEFHFTCTLFGGSSHMDQFIFYYIDCNRL